MEGPHSDMYPQCWTLSIGGTYHLRVGCSPLFSFMALCGVALGKKFNVYDMYPITVWRDETRALIKQHYNGLQGRLDACEYDTAFDSEE